MKLRSKLLFPLGEHDLMSRETAKKMIGQKAPAVANQVQIGNATVTNVDWESETEIYMTIEVEI